jgi:hypothetical protein
MSSVPAAITINAASSPAAHAARRGLLSVDRCPAKVVLAPGKSGGARGRQQQRHEAGDRRPHKGGYLRPWCSNVSLIGHLATDGILARGVPGGQPVSFGQPDC